MISSLIPDVLYRIVYRLGFAAAQGWWFLRRPHHDGALVAVWAGEDLLVVRQSYQPLWTTPGGGVKPGEDPAAAAARELGEETGLVVAPARLGAASVYEQVFRWRHDRVHFFDLRVDARLPCTLDRRELVEARWVTREQAESLPIVPHLRDYLQDRHLGDRPAPEPRAGTPAMRKAP